MNFKFKKTYIVLAVVLVIFLSVDFCQAAFLQQKVKNVIGGQTSGAGYVGGYDTSTGNIFSLIQTVISAFLSIIGVLLLIYMLYAGYNWMTAQGEEEKVEKAKDTLKRAIIGAIIIIAAYAISIFVMGRLEAGTLTGGKSPSPVPPATQNTPSTPVIINPEGISIPSFP